jgi:hypothetical protein
MHLSVLAHEAAVRQHMWQLGPRTRAFKTRVSAKPEGVAMSVHALIQAACIGVGATDAPERHIMKENRTPESRG